MKKIFRVSLKILGVIVLFVVIVGLGGWWYASSTFLSFEKNYAEKTEIHAIRRSRDWSYNRLHGNLHTQFCLRFVSHHETVMRKRSK